LPRELRFKKFSVLAAIMVAAFIVQCYMYTKSKLFFVVVDLPTTIGRDLNYYEELGLLPESNLD